MIVDTFTQKDNCILSYFLSLDLFFFFAKVNFFLLAHLSENIGQRKRALENKKICNIEKMK